MHNAFVMYQCRSGVMRCSAWDEHPSIREYHSQDRSTWQREIHDKCTSRTSKGYCCLKTHQYDQRTQEGSGVVGSPAPPAPCALYSSESRRLSDRRCRHISAERPRRTARCAVHKHHVQSHALALRKRCTSWTSLAAQDGLWRQQRPYSDHHAKRPDDRGPVLASLDHKPSVLRPVPPPITHTCKSKREVSLAFGSCSMMQYSCKSIHILKRPERC
jgi:hypothetical protein